MAALAPERVVALHLNLIGGRPPNPDDPLEGLGEDDRAYIAWKRNYDANESGYQAIQGTKPQSLAYGLTDSPAGLAAWIVEKFKTWSDCGDDIDAYYSKDQLLENIMLYWVTGTINSAMRMYYESIGPGRMAPSPERLETPTGHAQYPAEIRRTPRLWAEQAHNIVHWARMPRGGHFAAFEQPALFVDDLRAFFRAFR
jgi:microsomal epoxide hydrolase